MVIVWSKTTTLIAPEIATPVESNRKRKSPFIIAPRAVFSLDLSYTLTSESVIEITSATFVASAKVSSFATRYPATTATPSSGATEPAGF